jgi:large subunit ribosomal protein L21
MFAVVADGSRQLRVEEGDVVNVDYREGLAPGDAVKLESVLLANGGGASSIGRPLISGAVVQAVVVNPEFKGEKIEIQKFRRRKNSRRHTGHRQKYTTVRVKAIEVPGLQIVKDNEPAAK